MKTEKTLACRIYRFTIALVIATLVVACASAQPAPDTLVNEPHTQPAATLPPSSVGVSGGEWSLVKAAEPYRGVSVTVSFLPRPGYEAAISLIPQFEQLTGIKVRWESIYYEQMRNALVLDFTSDTPKFDAVLIDVVWVGEFASAGWITPLPPFYNDPALADPNLDLDDFFPILLESFGTWDERI
ncbi:MAG TPA: extracellular solute-binding protein, partial [Anaerolineales bacterium]|nr:extracellular solute-binding protein [Anaerolineales bacterium]